jgi:hypothetical protein
MMNAVEQDQSRQGEPTVTNSTNEDSAADGPLLLSMKTTAQVLGLSVWQVKKLADLGALPVTPVNGRKYIAAKAVHQFAHGTTPKDAA